MARISPLTKVFPWLVAAIVIIGAGARFADLAGHFSHADDLGVAAIIFEFREVNKNPFWAVPSFWTYAPFQFLITPLLISPEQDYRTLLFGGRFPSFIFSTLSLAGLLLVYRRFDPAHRYEALTALALCAVSWEHIIYAKQMHNYGLVCLGSVGLMVMVLSLDKEKAFSLRRMVLHGMINGLWVFMHYQFLFLLPAYWGTAFCLGWRRCPKRGLFVMKWILSVSVSLALVYPVWRVFLSRHLAAGNRGLSDWNKGWNLEFFFQWPAGQSWWDGLRYTVGFFAKNTFLVFQTNFGFFDQSSGLFPAVIMLLMILAFIGGGALVFSRSAAERGLGIFFGLLGGGWIILIVLQKVTLSPTRHYLVFLPLMAVAAARGLTAVAARFVNEVRLPGMILFVQTVTAVAVMTAALFSFTRFFQERRDPFSEKSMASLLETYQPDAIIEGFITPQIMMMKSVRDYYGGFFDHGFSDYRLITDGRRPYRRVAWISQRRRLTPESYAVAKAHINNYLAFSNPRRARKGKPVVPFLKSGYGDFKIVFMEERDSEVQMDFLKTREIDNGTNGYYVYVLEKL
jgi:hypothetical protein